MAIQKCNKVIMYSLLRKNISRFWKVSSNLRDWISGVVGECEYYFCACFSCYARLTNDPWYERRGDLFLLIPSPNYRTNFSRLSRGLVGAQEYRSPYANRSANKNFPASHLCLCLSCCTLKNYYLGDKLFTQIRPPKESSKSLNTILLLNVTYCDAVEYFSKEMRDL